MDSRASGGGHIRSSQLACSQVACGEIVAAAGEILGRVRARRPRIHCITNTVAQAFTANALLAMGAVPSMTTSPDEIGAFVAGADGLLVNLGTLEPERREVIHLAIDAAARASIPWLLDPVFIDRSPARAAFALALLERRPAAVRGNESEIATLAAGEGPEALARRLGAVVTATGESDRITDGAAGIVVANGHALMARVTAMGCAGAAVTTAFLALGDDPLVAVAAAMAVLGVAGEMAAEEARGPGSFAPAYLDALHTLDAGTLAARARLRNHQTGDAP